MKVHMSCSVQIGGAAIPACGSYGSQTTAEWAQVTCKACANRRTAIDARNRRLEERFRRMRPRRQSDGDHAKFSEC